MATADELLDALMKECKKPEDLIGADGLLGQLFRTTLHLEKQAVATDHPGNPHRKEWK
ncbi:MAG: hypothetical protein WC007_06690 [Pelobacteraceae bacterium]